MTDNTELPSRLRVSCESTISRLALVAFLLLLPSLVWASDVESSEAAGRAFLRDVEAGRIVIDGLSPGYVVLRTQCRMALGVGKVDEAVRLQERLVGLADATLPTAVRMRCRTEQVRMLFAYGRTAQGKTALEGTLGVLKSLGPERIEYVPPLMAVAGERFQAGDLETGEWLRNALLDVMGNGSGGSEHAETAVRAYVREPYLSKQRIAVVEAWLSSRRAEPGRRGDGLMAQAAFALARQYAYRGNLQVARSYLQYAGSVWTAIFNGESQEQLQFYGLMGKLAESMGDFGGAEKSYRQGIELGLRYYDPGVEKVAALRNDLSRLLLRKGALDECGRLVRKTIRDVTNRQGQFRFQVGRGFFLLAMTARARGDAASASKYLKRAVDIMAFTLPEEHPDLIEARISMAEDLLRTGQYALASPLAEQAMAGSRKLFGESSPIEVRALAVIGAVEKHRGDSGKAYTIMRRAEQMGADLARKMEQFPSMEARKSFFEASRRNVENLFDVLDGRKGDTRLAAEVYDVWLNRKGIFFDSQMRFQQLQMADKTPQEEDLLAQLLAVRMEIASLAFSASKSGDKAKSMHVLLTHRNAFVEKLRAMHGGVLADKPCSWTGISLPAGSALVDFASVGGSYKAFVLMPGAGPSVVDLGEAKGIDAALLSLRREVAKGREYDPGNGGKQSLYLHSRLFGPLSGLLGNAERIIVVPDGLLNVLPMGILSPEAGKFLIETHRFSYLATARELLGGAATFKPTDRVVAFANPDFGAVIPDELVRVERPEDDAAPSQGERRITLSLPPLPETEKEGRTIVQMAGGNGVLFTGAGASKMALFGQKRPRILHLATHGFFFSKEGNGPAKGARGFVIEDAAPQTAEVWLGEDVEPLLRSGMVLAGANSARLGAGLRGNGLLTAEEVLSLDLLGTKLVTLSACDTGLGVISDADGVYGLRRSFRLAGAADLVLSMWSVPDRETRELMVAMYGRILKGKETPGRALHEATLERLERVRAEGKSDNPLLWTGFIQYGVD